MNKFRLLRTIGGNISWVFSFGFWRGTIYGDFKPVYAIMLLVLFTACADILRMVFVRGYPSKTAP